MSMKVRALSGDEMEFDPNNCREFSYGAVISIGKDGRAVANDRNRDEMDR